MNHEAIQQESFLRPTSKVTGRAKGEDKFDLINLHIKGFAHPVAEDICRDTETLIS